MVPGLGKLGMTRIAEAIFAIRLFLPSSEAILNLPLIVTRAESAPRTVNESERERQVAGFLMRECAARKPPLSN